MHKIIKGMKMKTGTRSRNENEDRNAVLHTCGPVPPQSSVQAAAGCSDGLKMHPAAHARVGRL